MVNFDHSKLQLLCNILFVSISNKCTVDRQMLIFVLIWRIAKNRQIKTIVNISKNDCNKL